MAFAASKYNNIAAFYLQVAFRDGDGYPMGQETAPDDVSSDTTTSAYRIDGLIDLTPGTPTVPVVTNLGGQKVISKTRVAAQDYGTPAFQLSQRDETFEAYVTNSAVDVSSNTTRAIRGMNAAQKIFPDFMVLFGIQVTNSETGQTQWDNYAYLNCNIGKAQDAGAGQITGDAVNPNPLQYNLDLSLATRHISGELISGLTIAVSGNEDAALMERTDNPLALTTYVADGTETTFTLPYLPISDDATGAAQNYITINGTPTAVTSVSTTTGLVTLDAAGTDGDKVVVLYETNFTPSG